MNTTKLMIGSKAPDFKSIDQDGKAISLSDFKGKNLILYFYPKDNTPGCTAEACSLRDGYDKLIQIGYDVVGVSTDSIKSHQNFISKYKLPFRLISDADRKVCMAFGVWGEKKMYGKTYEGIIRTTFIINKEGTISQIFTKVDTDDHVNQILNSIEKP